MNYNALNIIEVEQEICFNYKIGVYGILINDKINSDFLNITDSDYFKKLIKFSKYSIYDIRNQLYKTIYLNDPSRKLTILNNKIPDNVFVIEDNNGNTTYYKKYDTEEEELQKIINIPLYKTFLAYQKFYFLLSKYH